MPSVNDPSNHPPGAAQLSPSGSTSLAWISTSSLEPAGESAGAMSSQVCP